MIGLIRGELAAKTPAEVLVLAAGIGYEIQIPARVFDGLPATGAEVALHTHFAVREDAQVLFGFLDSGDKTAFRHLIRVSGVGPRLALALLSGMNAGELAVAVRDGDSARLSAVPGVGKKTAQRLLVELRGRLNEMDAAAPPTSGPAATPVSRGAREAREALISLGYKPQQAVRLIAAAQRENPTLEDAGELIRLALQSVTPGAGGGA